MLLELHIRDFAIIDSLSLTLASGFNVLTGETGAGKSIIIDALGMLRGDKPDATMVRAGSTRARVEGVFSLAACPAVVPLLQGYELWDAEDENVILTREISAESGRSVARINRRAVNTGMLREVGSHLIDIHGQHEGLSLFNTRTHQEMLDRYGALLPLREQVAALVEQLREVRGDLDTLQQNEARRLERIDELHMLLEDVQAANLRPEEEQELLQERQMTQHAVRITELATSAYALLAQGDPDPHTSTRPLVEGLSLVAGDLEELARFDPSVQAMSEQATDVQYHLEDLAASLRDYRDRLDFDPRRLDEIEERLTLIRSLQRKYGCTIGDLLEQAAQAESEIDRLTHSAEQRADLQAREHTLLAALGQQAAALSQQRREAGTLLSQSIEQSMADLAMPRVQFAVQLAHRPDPQGVRLEPLPAGMHDSDSEARYACDKTGVDQVEFLISPNPGEPLKPLARIASGGESARLLLALKSILSRVDSVASMVFDEIDVGVGGRAGQVVGQKLWAISEAHQVLCITHLPQVAAFADAHYAISKELVEAQGEGSVRTRTNIRALTTEQRIDELAAMLDGTPISDSSRANAREIIERAASYKQTERTQRPQANGSDQTAAYSLSPLASSS